MADEIAKTEDASTTDKVADVAQKVAAVPRPPERKSETNEAVPEAESPILPKRTVDGVTVTSF